MGDVTSDKKQIEQAVEIALYAPIGLALEARRLLPSFVERGRQQVNMAKVLGQFAVAHGQNTAKGKLGGLQAQAEATLIEFGLRPAPAAPAASSDEAEASSPETTAPVARSSAAAQDLPISDYDSLAASQVIPRLAGLAPAELEAVRTYELNHRGRKTILGKVAQLTEQ